MVWLFHGTVEDHLAGIFDNGLVSPTDDAQGGVFLSTRPVAGKGGDPVSFALGWPARHVRNRRAHRGYVIVVDLPDSAFALITRVIPNLAFDAYREAARLRGWLTEAVYPNGSPTQARWGVSLWCLLYWAGRFLHHQGSRTDEATVAAIVDAHVKSCPESLPADLTPRRWYAFLDDYFHLVDVRYPDFDNGEALERARQAVLARHGVRFPEWIEEDPPDDYDTRGCRMCVEPIFNYRLAFRGLSSYEPFREFLCALAGRRGFASAAPDADDPHLIDGGLRRPLFDNLGYLLRVVQAHTATYPQSAIERFLLLNETTWQWSDWYVAFPAQAPGLPQYWTAAPLTPQEVTSPQLRQPDTQVHASAIPAQYILGAIPVTDGRRLVPRLRPSRSRGQTLESLLWREVHRLRARYDGKPILLSP